MLPGNTWDVTGRVGEDAHNEVTTMPLLLLWFLAEVATVAIKCGEVGESRECNFLDR